MSARDLGERALLALWRACVEFVDDRGHRDAAQIAFFAVLTLRPAGDAARRRLRVVLRRRGPPPARRDDRLRQRPAQRGRRPRAAGAHRRRRARQHRPARPDLGRAADRRRQRRHGRAAPRDQPGVGHPHAPAARCAARRSTSRSCSARPPCSSSRSQLSATRARPRTGSATPAGRSTSSATCCRSPSRPPSCCSSTASSRSPRPKTREIWPGAVVAAALISLVRGLLELYFEHLADLGALYGSLGALMALLIFVYAVSLVLVFGAEYASEWSRLPETRGRNSLKSSRRRADTGSEPASSARPTTSPSSRTRSSAPAVSPPLNNPDLRPCPPFRAAGGQAPVGRLPVQSRHGATKGARPRRPGHVNADTLRARFDAPDALGIGIEEELFLLDPETLDLLPERARGARARRRRPALQARAARGAAGDRHAAVPRRRVAPSPSLARRPARPGRRRPSRTAG